MAAGIIGGIVATQGTAPSTAPIAPQQSSVQQAPTKQQSMVPAVSTAGLTAPIARAAKRYAAEGRAFHLNQRHAWVGRKIRGRFDFYCVPV